MIDGLQHTEGDNECSVCEIDFSDDEGGMLGYIGIIPVAFCPTCYVGICDMVEQLYEKEWEGLTDEERSGKRVLGNGLLFNTAEAQVWELAVDFAERKLKEKNGYE
jgi:hypothetical protein